MPSPSVIQMPGPEADIPELYKVYRAYIEHENGLIGQRISSGLAIHGFLFTVYGLALAKLTSETAPGTPAGALHPALLLVRYGAMTIGLTGMVTALITMASIAAAVVTILRLSRRWDHFAGPRADDLGLPRLSGAGSDLAMVLGFGTTLALPFVIVCCWGVMLGLTYNFALFG